MTVRILIADDHPIVRSGIENELTQQSDFEVVGEALNGDEALRKTIDLEPDILLLDARMPGTRSGEILRKIKERQRGCRVLILTAYNDTATVLGLLRAGADGYLLKDEETSVIVDAIRSVLKGERWLSPTVAKKVSRAVEEENKLMGKQLTSREMKVIANIVKGHTNKKISEELGVSERTVEFHVSNIVKKLGVKSRVDVAVFATEWGLIEE